MATRELAAAFAELRDLLRDADNLVRVTAGGRRRGLAAPDPLTARPIDLKSGPHMHVVRTSTVGPVTRNVPVAEADAMWAELLAEPFANWRVETTTATVQVRVTKKGLAQVHTEATSRRDVAPRAHDRVKERLIDPDDPLFAILGAGADKRRQVDAFLRAAQPALAAVTARRKGQGLRIVDLGCGNAYLTFAMHRFVGGLAPGSRTVGVDVRPELMATSAGRAAQAGLSGLDFVAGDIASMRLSEIGFDDGVDVVLALHACDTATDDALAQAIAWSAPVVLAAPCCHHDVQRQWAAHGPGPAVPTAIAAQPILSERFADVVTDAVRAVILRAHGYRVDVMEFVDSRHTPRNTAIRAMRTGTPDTSAAAELAAWQADFGFQPALVDRLAAARARSAA